MAQGRVVVGEASDKTFSVAEMFACSVGVIVGGEKDGHPVIATASEVYYPASSTWTTKRQSKYIARKLRPNETIVLTDS